MDNYTNIYLSDNITLSVVNTDMTYFRIDIELPPKYCAPEMLKWLTWTYRFEYGRIMLFWIADMRLWKRMTLHSILNILGCNSFASVLFNYSTTSDYFAYCNEYTILATIPGSKISLQTFRNILGILACSDFDPSTTEVLSLIQQYLSDYEEQS